MQGKEVWESGGGFPGGAAVKNPPANAGDAGISGSIPGSGRSPGGGNGNPLQYSCLKNPMDRGAWQATVRGVAESQTLLNEHTRKSGDFLQGPLARRSLNLSKSQFSSL